MRLAGLLFMAALAAAGCSETGDAVPGAGASPTPSPSPSPTYVGANLASGSWDKVWGDPAAMLTYLGRLGLRPGPYEQHGDRWRSEAEPTTLTDPSMPDVVKAYLTVSGTKDRLDTLVFRLVEPQMSNDQKARDAFDQWVKQPLDQLGVTGGDTVVQAIHGDKAARGLLRVTAGSDRPGARYHVTRETTQKERRLTVTFTRADATAEQLNEGSK